jgi:hypothetical protein
MARTVAVIGAVLMLLGSADVAGAAEFFSATRSLKVEDPTQTGRLFRDGTADNCTTAPEPASIGAPGTYHYELFSFVNLTNDSQCVTVSIDAMTCSGAGPNAIYSGAYIPSFSPAAITNNAVASAGSSPNPTGSYSFSVPAGSPFAVNVHEVNQNAFCSAYGIAIGSAKPWNTAPPSISGTPVVGQALIGTDGTWAGAPTLARQWRRCDGSGANCVDIAGATGQTYAPVPGDQGSTLRLRVTAVEGSETASADSGPSAAVAPAPAPPPTPDTLAPTVTSLSLTNKVFAVAAGATPRAAVKKGTSFRYSVSEAGRARFTIQRALPGRKVGRRCVKPTRSLRKKRRCTRYKTVGTLTRNAAAGVNSLAFTGRIGRKALRRGPHRARLVVTDGANNRSTPRSVTFRIVKAR